MKINETKLRNLIARSIRQALNEDDRFTKSFVMELIGTLESTISNVAYKIENSNPNTFPEDYKQEFMELLNRCYGELYELNQNYNYPCNMSSTL